MSESPPADAPSGVDTCPECGGPVTRRDGEVVCDDCGLLVEDERIDHGPEWRGFDADTRCRTGPPRSRARHDNGLGTEIGRSSGESSPAERRQRKQHDWAKTSTSREETEMHVQQEIRRLCDQLELSTALVEQTGSLYKSVQQADLHVGRAYEAVAAACVYAVCRISKNYRQLSEVSTFVAVSESRVENAFYAFVQELELPVPIRDPVEYIPQIASGIQIQQSTERRARDIAERAGDCQNLIGTSPSGIAAGAVWLAVQAEDDVAKQKDIAAAADVSRQTTRNISTRLQTLEIGPKLDSGSQ